jgi:alpha-L-rhamnosidase
MYKYLVLLSLLVAHLGGAALHIDRMECEHRTNPLGLDTTKPRLTWTFRPDGTTHGQRQTAYQIQVASSLFALQSDSANLWDSGKVESAETVLVPYAGKALKSDMDCFWRVRAWDQDGAVGPWSEVANWSMGFLNAGEWKAEWIGLPMDDGESSAPVTYLRTEFLLPSKPIRARLFITAAGLCEPSINGQRVTDDVFSPGWTQYDKRLYHRCYDVLPQLKTGENAIGVALGDGWYGLKHQGRGRTRIKAELHVTMADHGWTARISTGRSWRGTRSGPIRMSDIYNGEDYDARQVMTGWAEPGFAATDWRPVLVGHRDQTAWADVAPAIRRKLADNAASISVDNALVDKDPIHGVKKELRLDYTVDGQARSLRVPEKQAVLVTAPGGTLGKLAIVSARYGAKDKWIDATPKVRAAVRDGQLRIVATNEAFGDPIYGTVKNLEVTYRFGDGPEQTKTVAENATLSLVGATYALPRNATIVRAVYGAESPDAIAEATLQAHPGVPVRRSGDIPPVSISQPKPGNYVFDFGQNFAGWTRLKASAPAGTKVTLRFAEMLNKDGTVYTANLRSAKATDTYVFAGTGEEVWEPAFTFHGFRYVELTGLPAAPTSETLTGVVLRSAARETSTFTCSSPLVNQLYSNILWGQRSNYLEVPTDCPQRDERLGWSGDAQVFVRTGAYLMDTAPFFAAWLRTFNDCQTAEGGYPNYAPLGGGISPAWGDAGVICPWEIYQAYGDRRQLVAHYPEMVRWIEFLRERSTDLVRPAQGFGDWLHVNDDTPKDVISTAYFARVTRLVAEIAKIDGNTADAAKYGKLADDIAAAFRKAFVAPDGKIKGDSQTAYLLGLGFGLLTDTQREQAAQHLLRKLKSRDNLLSVGFVGVNLLLPVLTDIGHPELAYQLIQERRYPSWGYSIDNGATTIWERWNSYHKEKGFGNVGMNSFNHYSFGSCGEWMFGTMAGIKPLAPGYSRILVAPLPGPGIDHLDASYDSIRGTISVSWRRIGDGLSMSTMVPPNTTAEIHVPLAGKGSVTVNGKPLEQAEGLATASRTATALVLNAGSGVYAFDVR